MKIHWYDRLWNHLEAANDEGDEDRLHQLLVMRRAYGLADTDSEIVEAQRTFERWENELN